MTSSRAEIPPEQRVVFGQSFEALARTCGDPQPPEIVAAFHECGVDLGKLQVAYPLPNYIAAMEQVRKLRFPELPDEEAYFRLGRGFIDRYGTTLMGRAMLAMLPVLGTRRVLGRLTQKFRTATNYVTAQTSELRPGRAEVTIHPVVHADYYRGVLTAGLEVSGAKDLSIAITSRQDLTVVFLVTWTP